VTRDGGEPAERGKQGLVVAAADRPVDARCAGARFPEPQQIDEVASEHELDRTVVLCEVGEERRQLQRRVEDVAAVRSSDVGVGQEHEQRVLRQLVPDNDARRWFTHATESAIVSVLARAGP
jgi:hypothetical protein